MFKVKSIINKNKKVYTVYDEKVETNSSEKRLMFLIYDKEWLWIDSKVCIPVDDSSKENSCNRKDKLYKKVKKKQLKLMDKNSSSSITELLRLLKQNDDPLYQHLVRKAKEEKNKANKLLEQYKESYKDYVDKFKERPKDYKKSKMKDLIDGYTSLKIPFNTLIYGNGIPNDILDKMANDMLNLLQSEGILGLCGFDPNYIKSNKSSDKTNTKGKTDNKVAPVGKLPLAFFENLYNYLTHIYRTPAEEAYDYVAALRKSDYKVDNNSFDTLEKFEDFVKDTFKSLMGKELKEIKF